MAVHEVYVETLCESRDRWAETRTPHAGNPSQWLKRRDVIKLETLALFGAWIPAIANDMHLVAKLDEPAPPANDVEGAQIGDSEQT